MFSLYTLFSKIFKNRIGNQKDFSPSVTDTLLAIDELSTLIKNDVETVEVYLALASLYRVQGDIEKAVQIHAQLLSRVDMPTTLRARVYFELGKDYKRAGFIDRALTTFLQAKELGGLEYQYTYELAEIYAILEQYEMAALTAKKMGETTIQAFYLLEEISKMPLEDVTSIQKKINKIIAIEPDMPKAWVYKIQYSMQYESLKENKILLKKALDKIQVSMHFVLLEHILDLESIKNDTSKEIENYILMIIEVLSSYNNNNIIVSYYIALFYKKIGFLNEAKTLLLEIIEVQDSFWPAHFEVFSLILSSSEKSFDTMLPHMNFFMKIGKSIRKFFCSSCGLKLHSPFYQCPRCKNWKTVHFRKKLDE